MKDYIEAWSKVDVLLTPVTLSPPPLFSEFSNVDNRTQTATQDFCTQPMNLAGLNKVCRLKQVYLSSMLSNEKVYLFKSAHFIMHLNNFLFLGHLEVVGTPTLKPLPEAPTIRVSR